MTSERRRPAEIRAEQQRALVRYLREEVHPLSRHYRAALDRAGYERSPFRSLADLPRLPVTEPSELTDLDAVVLRPEEGALLSSGPWELRWRVLWGRLLGRRAKTDRDVIEPVYKLVHYVGHQGYLLANTAEDLERLAELGRRWLQHAGLRRSDRLASMVPGGLRLDHWQLALGARRAGVAALHLDGVPDPTWLARMGPTVLAGEPADLEKLLGAAEADGVPLATVHTLLTTGPMPDDADRRRMIELLDRTDAAVVAAWGPPGVRAVWAECRAGEGLHTWPDAEVLEVLDPESGAPVRAGELGELVWSALGWRGTVLLRLRTGVAGTLDTAACPHCGRGTPRVRPARGRS